MNDIVKLNIVDEPTIFDEIIALKDGPVQYEKTWSQNTIKQSAVKHTKSGAPTTVQI